jgi:hypothetical protein
MTEVRVCNAEARGESMTKVRIYTAHMHVYC